MISIIVPALEEAGGIVPVLAPLQAWRKRGHEVVVVDGGSRDATVALAARLADRVLVTPAGRARQMNAGAAVGRGDVLLFLHADTRLPAGADADIARGVARGSGWGRFDVRLSGRHPALRVIGAAINLRSRLGGMVTGDQALFLRRELFERVGGFPAVDLMEDLELSLRLRTHGPPLCLRGPAITSGRRWERYGVVRTVLTMWWLRSAWACGVAPAWLARRYHER